MPFISYAQNYEDVILWRALRDLDKGFYVDVGAADPEEWSVTRAFYDRGWSGINLEPLDEYFDKLTQARPRDTNLQVAVGREAGLRVLHAVAGTGLSTFDSRFAARHQAAGWQVHETVVPVLTLATILEHFGPPIIHFLKIDVEGAEVEVLEGLNLDRVRPWIIVVEATEPFSTVSTRDSWEYLLTGHGYSFAYFDGLNCFYIADEVSVLKERLAVPPNVFDEFLRFPEWSSDRKAATLEQGLADLRDRMRAQEQASQAQSANLRSALEAGQVQSANLRSALQAEQAQTVNLSNALQAERAQTANRSNALQAEEARIADLRNALQAEEARTADLRNALQTEQTRVADLRNALQTEQTRVAMLHSGLQAEQGQVANLHNIVQTEQANAGYLMGRIQQLEAELAAQSHYGGVFGSIREIGDQMTGGGLRSLGKRTRGLGDRITGGGLRNLAKRVLLVLGRAVLKPFPKLTTSLGRLTTTPDAVAIPSALSASRASPPDASATRLVPSDGNQQLATLPASARSMYQKLRAAMSDSNTWNQNR